MHFHELRFLEFTKRWWWRRGTLLENSTRTGTGQAAQRPAGLLRVWGASQPSPTVTAQTGTPPLKQKASEISSMLLLVGEQTGQMGESIWEREDFPQGCCAAHPLEQHTVRHRARKIKFRWMSLWSVPLHIPFSWSVLPHSQQSQQPGSQHVHQTTGLHLLKEPTDPWYSI